MGVGISKDMAKKYRIEAGVKTKGDTRRKTMEENRTVVLTQ
jgi:hypothetical protein